MASILVRVVELVESRIGAKIYGYDFKQFYFSREEICKKN